MSSSMQQPTGAAQSEEEWWDAQVEALLERAEQHFAPREGADEQAAERYLGHIRTLIDCAVEQLQHVALHNPCGDGEVVELPSGEEACAGCFNADGSEQQ